MTDMLASKVGNFQRDYFASICEFPRAPSKFQTHEIFDRVLPGQRVSHPVDHGV